MYTIEQVCMTTARAQNATAFSTATLDKATTAGNTLIAFVRFSSYSTDAATLTLTGAGNETWVNRGGSGDAWQQAACWTAENIAGGSTDPLTLTVTGRADNRTDWGNLVLVEVSGVKAASFLAASYNAASVAADVDAVTSGLLGVLSEQPAALVGFGGRDFGGSADTTAVGTGFTDITDADTYEVQKVEHRRLTSTDSVAATFTGSVFDWHFSIAVALAEDAGGSVALTIDDVDTDDSVYPGQTANANGSNMADVVSAALEDNNALGLSEVVSVGAATATAVPLTFAARSGAALPYTKVNNKTTFAVEAGAQPKHTLTLSE